MAQEFEALIYNGTWTLCPRTLQQHVIKNRWVYKIKQRPNGSLERFKARLVGKGHEQQSGVDYSKTFNPVIKSSTIRIILALTVNFNWPIKQLDVSNAFLHSTLMEEVFIEQPKSFCDSTFPDYVCRLDLFMVSSKLPELGFIASLIPFWCLGLLHHWWILFFLSTFMEMLKLLCSFMLMTFLLLVHILLSFKLLFPVYSTNSF